MRSRQNESVYRSGNGRNGAFIIFPGIKGKTYRRLSEKCGPVKEIKYDV
jgi:hypothetical protein